MSKAQTPCPRVGEETAAINAAVAIRKRNKLRKQQRHAAGLCVVAGCDRPLFSKWYCLYHRNKHNEDNRRYKAGLSKPIMPKGEIDTAKAIKDYRYQKSLQIATKIRRRAAGVCVVSGCDAPVITTNFCEKHRRLNNQQPHRKNTVTPSVCVAL
jgi:hypothetical protein